MPERSTSASEASTRDSRRRVSSGKRTTAYAVPRRPSPLGGRRPTKDDIDSLRRDPRGGVDDVLPADGSSPRLLIVGINPGLWTAAVNAPFAHPGNRFWPSLDRAGITDGLVDVSRGMSPEQADVLVRRGVAMTNLVARPTARADELGREELRTGGERLVRRVAAMRPRTVAIVGITAFRTAFRRPHARLGLQGTDGIAGWPPDVALWVVPQPSGLNAHETVDSLAAKWREVWGMTRTDSARRSQRTGA